MNCRNNDREKAALEIIAIELGRAKSKHPDFPGRDADAGMIIAEEKAELDCAFDKFCKSINDRNAKQHMIEEAAHVAVTAIRFIESKLS